MKRVTKCFWCRKKIKPNKRGRPATYCSASCRQRAYEKRKHDAEIPLKLLDRDIQGMQEQTSLRRLIVKILGELGIIEAVDTAPKAPVLRLVPNIENDETEEED